MADLEELLQQATAASQKTMPPIISGVDLMAMDFPEPAWLVESLIPVGMTILAGPPKKGKSWLALELALAVCSGGDFIGRKVQIGRVLYAALEDSPRRLKDRLQKQGWGPKALANLDVIFGRRFHELFGGKDGLMNFTAFLAASDYTLVVVDTISRAFQIRDWNDAAAVTPVLSPLQELVSESGKSLWALDHHKKRNGFGVDPIEDILGSVSKSGVADTVVGLYKEQGKPGAKLAVVGRDVEEQTLELRFDAFLGCWTETARDDGLTDKQRELLNVLDRMGGQATLTEIEEATNGNRGNLYKLLDKLQERGFVIYKKRQWQIIRSEETEETKETEET